MRSIPKCTAPSQALDLTRNTHFYCILTDLIDSLWSIVKKSFARNPVVFSQLHSILGTEKHIRKGFKTILQAKRAAGRHFIIIPAAGNESLLAIPYLTSRSAYGQSTDPLRTRGTIVASWNNSVSALSVFTQDIQDKIMQQAAHSCHL